MTGLLKCIGDLSLHNELINLAQDPSKHRALQEYEADVGWEMGDGEYHMIRVDCSLGSTITRNSDEIQKLGILLKLTYLKDFQ